MQGSSASVARTTGEHRTHHPSDSPKMPTRLLPKTPAQRLTAMRVIAERAASMPAHEVPLPGTVTDWLTAFMPVYRVLINEVNKAKSLQIGATAAVLPLLRDARIWVGQGYQHIVDAVVRGTVPRAALTGYGMTLRSRGPKMRKGEQDVLQAAVRLQAAETARVSKGGEPMAFPSLEEIMERVEAFKIANQLQADRKLALSDAQRNLRQANAEAKKLVLRLWNTIETAYDTGDRPSTRRKAREWGVIYSIAKGEKASEQEDDEQSPEGQ